jgi:hypothetical protein
MELISLSTVLRLTSPAFFASTFTTVLTSVSFPTLHTWFPSSTLPSVASGGSRRSVTDIVCLRIISTFTAPFSGFCFCYILVGTWPELWNLQVTCRIWCTFMFKMSSVAPLLVIAIDRLSPIISPIFYYCTIHTYLIYT